MRIAWPKSAPQTAQEKIAEKQQTHRGVTFTEFGSVALNVRSVENGRLTLEQNGKELRPLPETVAAILTALQNDAILSPTPRGNPFEVDILKPFSTEEDHYHVWMTDRQGTSIQIQDRATGQSIAVQTAHLEEVGNCIVRPWLAVSQMGPPSVSSPDF